ncbi:hypothetical protein CLOM_g5492 [Closterium sp. NIES-68]|nr:hypothetical protein CLOM_g5492 [Closterium sp. NIES-68]GJP69339.1 hypothetical protein CLOP_g277 [Closterium sp. NIES-67]
MMEHRRSSKRKCEWMLFAATVLSAFTLAQCIPMNRTFTTDVLTLNQLKSSFQSSVGALSSWKGSHPCAAGPAKWRGIGCLNDLKKRIAYVAKIDLRGLGLQGTIPRAIGNFKNLRSLDLSNNSLSGKLPLEMAKMMSLKTLILDNNQFTGNVRGLIGIPNLKILSLANNQLFGRLRDVLLDLVMLEHVVLSRNNFKGALPRTIHLRNLKVFDLSHNQLFGNLPFGLRRSKQLQKLDLSFNNFTGVIPPIWGSLKSLQQLFLNDNLLNGSLPKALADCSSLVTLELQNNRLSGPVPPRFANLPKLKELFLMNNNFSGMMGKAYVDHGILFRINGNRHLCVDLDSNGRCDPDNQSNPNAPGKPNLPSTPTEPAQPPPSQGQGGEGQGEGNTPRGEVGGAGEAGGEAGGGAGAAAAVCAAGQAESCECADGQTGEKKCLDDGTGYGECVCAAAAPPPSGGSSSWKWLIALLVLVLIALLAVAGYWAVKSGFIGKSKGAGWEYVGRVKAFPDMKAYRSHAYDPDDLDGYGVPAFDSLPKHPSDGAAAAAKPGAAKLTLTRFSLEELQLATNNFNVENVISTDGVCRTLSGVLPSGLYVAVKEMDPLAHESPDAFVAAAEMFSGVRCPQLVEVLGVCADRNSGGRRHHLLVYELVPNGSLDMHLHDLEPGTLPLDWTTRMCICLDVGKGLAYLHSLHPQLMHEGLQATCVVLDDHFHAKLADYCLPTLAANSSGGSAAARTSALTHSVNMAVAAGTAAPELAWASEMTPRVDVYAFGVLLLQLITGRRPVDNTRPPNEQSLVHWAKSRLSQRSLVEAMVDEKLHGSISTAALYQVAMLASQCIHSDPEARPTMAQAVEMLAKVQNLPLDSASSRQTVAYHKGPATYNKNV